MRTLTELIRWRAHRRPDLEAIWYDGKSQSYDELKMLKCTLREPYWAGYERRVMA